MSQDYRCDPIVISMELDIPARLAGTFVYYARVKSKAASSGVFSSTVVYQS